MTSFAYASNYMAISREPGGVAARAGRASLEPAGVGQ
jgi:hypothetical protein